MHQQAAGLVVLLRTTRHRGYVETVQARRPLGVARTYEYKNGLYRCSGDVKLCQKLHNLMLFHVPQLTKYLPHLSAVSVLLQLFLFDASFRK